MPTLKHRSAERTAIYLDFNATTPLDPRVREAMMPFWGDIYGNPSSVHQIGRTARAALDDNRERLASVWKCKPSEITFTSGRTESNNLAICGVARSRRDRGRHLITSAVEHHSVLHCFEYLAKKEGYDVTVLPVDAEGRVNVNSLSAALRPDTILVSIMAGNNEIGTLQPVREIGTVCRERGILFHTDAAQCFGKIPFESIHQFEADLVTACAHKFHGPKGSGAIYIRSPLRIDPIILGGGHEQERRAGTEHLAGIVGFVEAFSLNVCTPAFSAELIGPLAQRLITGLQKMEGMGVQIQGTFKERLINTVAFSVKSCDSMTLLAGLDIENICASSGSACVTGSLEPSHVLRATMGEAADKLGFIRLSLGRTTTEAEIERVLEVLPGIIARGQHSE